MSIVIKFFKETFNLFIERNLNEKNDIYRLLYFPVMYGVAYCLSSIFVVVNIFGSFYRPFDQYWLINFSHWAIESSHNFYTVFKNSIRIAVSIAIGAIVSYASLAMVGEHVWPNCFIFLVYVFLTTGPMMSSKLLPFEFGKFQFISYYFLTFSEIKDRSTYYSPIIHLKFVLASVTSIGVCIITCIIFRMKFGSGLFLKSTINIFKEIKAYIRISQKQISLIVENKNRNKELEKDLKELNEKHLKKKEKDLEKNKTDDIDYEDPLNLYYKNGHHPHHHHHHHHNFIPHILHHKNDGHQNNQKNHKNKSGYQQRNKEYFLLHKHYKKKLDFHYYEYSNQLNKLNSYLNDSKKESFGRRQLVYHYEKIQILLERNHKKLYAIGFGIRQECDLEVSKKLLPLLPLINELITEIENIFNTMEKQLSKKYIHSDNHQYSEWFKKEHENFQNNDWLYEKENERNLEFDNGQQKYPFKIDHLEVVLNFKEVENFKPNSLEWHQNQINQSFKRIDKIIEEIEQTFIVIFNEKIIFNPHKDNSMVKIFYSIAGFKSFSIEQKFLSKEVFLVSYHLSLKRFQPREFRFLANVFGRLNLFFKNLFFKKENQKSKNQLKQEKLNEIKINKIYKLNYSKLLLDNFKSILFDRILFNWIFSLKYSLVIGILSVVIYEIQLHSSFILFGRLAWLLDTFILVSAPDVGAISFVSSMRIIGTIIGGFAAYTCIVLSKLGHSSIASAWIYIGFSFFAITTCSFLVQGQPFDTMLKIIVFTYTTISVPQYLARQEDIIYALFKIMYVVLGSVLVLVVALIIPYFDFKQLEKNLYRIPKAIIEMVDFLMEYSFNETSKVLMENKDLTSGNPSLEINDQNQQQQQQKQITFRQYRLLIGKKYINLRKIFPAQRQLLIDSGFELIFKYQKFKKISYLLHSIEELHNLFGSFEFMVIQQPNDQATIRKIGNTVKNENRELLNNLQHTSTLLSKLPPQKDNVGFTKRMTSKLQLTITQDNSIQLLDQLTIHLNSILIKDYSKISIIQFHRINAVLFSLYCFVDEYHNVFNNLIHYKNIIVVDELNNNNYRNTNHEKEIKDHILNIKK